MIRARGESHKEDENSYEETQELVRACGLADVRVGVSAGAEAAAEERVSGKQSAGRGVLVRGRAGALGTRRLTSRRRVTTRDNARGCVHAPPRDGGTRTLRVTSVDRCIQIGHSVREGHSLLGPLLAKREETLEPNEAERTVFLELHVRHWRAQQEVDVAVPEDGVVPLTACAVVRRALHRRTTANRGQRALIKALLLAVLGEDIDRTVIDAVASQCRDTSVREVRLGGDKACRDDKACQVVRVDNFAALCQLSVPAANLDRSRRTGPAVVDELGGCCREGGAGVGRHHLCGHGASRIQDQHLHTGDACDGRKGLLAAVLRDSAELGPRDALHHAILVREHLTHRLLEDG